MLEYGATPHVAQNTSNRRGAIDRRTTRHPSSARSSVERLSRILPRARSAIAATSIAPATSASSISRPDRARMSLPTDAVHGGGAQYPALLEARAGYLQTNW